jgi:hypothetical protein
MHDEGILQICSLENIAEEGMMPTEKLVVLESDYYAKKSASYNRIYAAMGANHKFDMIVRVFNTSTPTDGMYVVLDNGDQYQIDVCQEIVGKDCIDLTLIKVEDYYDVAESTESGGDSTSTDSAG